MKLYAITDRSLLAAASGDLEAALCTQADAWARAGVPWVQVREKDLAEATLARLARRLAAAVRAAGGNIRLVVNGLPAALALDCGVDGMHLTGGASAESIEAARRAGACVSVSCHTLPEVAAAQAGGADVVLWGPVFGKVVQGVEIRAGTGLSDLEEACAAAGPVPVFALGGVTAANAGECMRAGAAGVAGIRLFLDDEWRRLL